MHEAARFRLPAREINCSEALEKRFFEIIVLFSEEKKVSGISADVINTQN